MPWRSTPSPSATWPSTGVDGLLDLLLRAGPYGRLPRALQPTADALRDFLAGEAGGGRLTRMLAALPARRTGLLPVLRAQALFSETRRGLDLATLKAHPHGLDLGPLRPGLPEQLAHPGGASAWRRRCCWPTCRGPWPGSARPPRGWC